MIIVHSTKFSGTSEKDVAFLTMLMNSGREVHFGQCTFMFFNYEKQKDLWDWISRFI